MYVRTRSETKDRAILKRDREQCLVLTQNGDCSHHLSLETLIMYRHWVEFSGRLYLSSGE